MLVIDDDAIVRLMTAESLGEAGCDVIEAASGEDGCALFERSVPDLVLLDVILPGMNGFEVCVRLRAQAGGANVPIIVMTGLDDRESIVEAYESGATDFITKPIVWDLLPYRVRYALRANAALQETVRSRALLSRSQALANMGSWEWSRLRDGMVWSDEMHRIHGTEPAAAAPSLLAPVHLGDRGMVERSLRLAQGDGEAYGIEFRIVRPDGEVRRVFEQTDIERDATGEVCAVRGIRRDITQQTEANERIRTLAFFDPLTGLGNRAMMGDLMTQWLAHAALVGARCAVLMIHIDRYRLVNETLGPRIDDELLKAVAERMRYCLRGVTGAGSGRAQGAEDRLVRLGGDEFAVLLVDIEDPMRANLVARRVADALERPVVVAGHELAVTASIGIVMTPDDGVDMDALLRNAGTAMHAAQREAHPRIRFYDGGMSADILRRHTLEAELRRAVDRGELRVHYQPKVDLRSARVVGAEALVRWEHPVRGLLGPMEFLPVAQTMGLIVPITHWIVDEVCAQVAAWRDAGLAIGPVSINLDAASMQDDDLVASVEGVLARFGLAPAAIEFEVTESTLVHDLERASHTLQRLGQIGVKLAIDDFGTGYSSLTYLKRLPLDVLKIDRSFVQDAVSDARGAALATAIVAMGQSLGLEIVAEGVETWAQADFLAQRGCFVVQGFLFARALPAEAFAALLQRGLPARETLLETA